MNKIEKLRAASLVAPAIRNDSGRGRKFRVIDDSGEVVGTIDATSLAESVARRADIEFDAIKPKFAKCTQCGSWFNLTKDGRQSKRCEACRTGKGQTTCAGFNGPCDEKPYKYAFLPSKIRYRHGEPWRCAACSKKKSIAAMSTDKRSAISKKRWASMTPEQRRTYVNKARAARTPEQRGTATKKMHASRTPEQRSLLVKKAWETRRKKAKQERPPGVSTSRGSRSGSGATGH